MSDEESMEARMRQQREAHEASPATRAKRRFAGALREVLDELEASVAPPGLFEAHAETLAALARELRAHAPSPPDGDAGAFTGMETFFDRSPIVGLANPLAPPAELEHFPDDQAVRGTVEFGKAFEGGPGLVHGGFLAALLDEALGVVTIYSGSPGMTGEYTLRYHAPTRIKVPLRFEARFDRREGRKIHVSADLWDGDVRTVSARGVFIAVDGAKFRAFHDARSDHVT